MVDALVSLGIVIGGVIIYYTHWYWIDPVLSIVIVLVILSGTWQLLKDSFKLSLDGVPANINLNELKKLALKIPGVQDFHHLHVWAISTTENAMTAHLVLAEHVSLNEEQAIKQRLKHQFEHEKIQHCTLETERDGQICRQLNC